MTDTNQTETTEATETSAAAQVGGKTATTKKTAAKKKAATTKKKVAKKAAAKPAASKGVDLIAETAHEIENLDLAAAVALVSSVDSETRLAHFRMGGALALIQKNEWWKDETDSATGERFEQFAVYVEQTFGFSYRTARTRVETYEKLVEIGVDYESIAAVGWSKFTTMVPVLDKENWKSWLEKAKVLGRRALEEEVKAARRGTLEGGSETTTNFKTKSFRVAKDDLELVETAIKTALEEADTDHTGVALVGICTAYNAGNLGGKAAPSTDLKAVLSEHSWEEVMTLMADLHPELDFNVEVPEEQPAK